jgi:hypothetical protein
MNDIIFTSLKCSNPDLIGSGSTLITENKELIIKNEDDEVRFQHRGWLFHDKLSEFSKQSPSEIFHVTAYNATDIDESTEWEMELLNGDFEQIGAKPVYHVWDNQKENIDVSIRRSFENKVSEFLQEYPPHNILPKNFKEQDDLDAQYMKDGLKVFLTFQYEDQSYRITADNESGYVIEAKYENKENENLDRVLLQLKILKLEIEELRKTPDDTEYYNLPF